MLTILIANYNTIEAIFHKIELKFLVHFAINEASLLYKMDLTTWNKILIWLYSVSLLNRIMNAKSEWI